MINKANEYLRARGYTEHGYRHVNYVSRVTAYILSSLPDGMVELGAIAATFTISGICITANITVFQVPISYFTS